MIYLVPFKLQRVGDSVNVKLPTDMDYDIWKRENPSALDYRRYGVTTTTNPNEILTRNNMRVQVRFSAESIGREANIEKLAKLTNPCLCNLTIYSTDNLGGTITLPGLNEEEPKRYQPQQLGVGELLGFIGGFHQRTDFIGVSFEDLIKSIKLELF